tara:strand:- start:129 stop:755 length:627 start_codon:yes stop_codon:yes gene_type:complete
MTPTISYAITVYNEITEIKKLISLLSVSKREEDEIVVLMDSKGPDEVWEYLLSVEDELGSLNKEKFDNNFSNWKNLLTSYCSNDYIFNIDADEYPNMELMKVLPQILNTNLNIDMFYVPRVNLVEGLTEAHIKQWGWRVNEKTWVNWPDYQMRVYRNSNNIKWKNRVHEVLEGYDQFTTLPEAEEYALYHPKQIKRQEEQNNFYATLG